MTVIVFSFDFESILGCNICVLLVLRSTCIKEYNLILCKYTTIINHITNILFNHAYLCIEYLHTMTYNIKYTMIN